MKTLLRTSLVATFLCLGSVAATEVPRVLETIPAAGDRSVDPDTTEIRVVFDRPMAPGSWSWCGGGYLYPEITAAPYFEDERTAVLPVKLEQQHSYTLLINCPSGQNFRSVEGKPAESYRLHFTTTFRDWSSQRIDAQNKASFDRLLELILNNYSYYDRLGIDWQAEFAELEEFILSSPNAQEFLIRILPTFEKAEDKHLRFYAPDGESVRPYRKPGFFNGNHDAIKRAFSDYQISKDAFSRGTLDGIGYIGVYTWSAKEMDYLVLHHWLDEMMELPVLIIDVRGNGGGNETDARGVAGRFIDEAAPYAKHQIRNPEATDGWQPVSERWLRPAPEEKRYRGEVIVLQGEVCLSSNESFIQMMKLSPRVRTMGATTGGSSARPMRHDLPNGLQVSLPSWRCLDMEGNLLEGRGIDPDIPVRGNFSVADPVLEAAIELARSLKPAAPELPE